jgi:oxygen-independent coproporphyrinogen-3 oxidase
MTSLERQVNAAGLFQGYAYGYPHKMAYRPLVPSVPLEQAWDDEDKEALFLYAHIPFCGVRCGFCNLFTTTGADGDLVNRYLDAIERQVDAVLEAVGHQACVARTAIGGGTPTFLEIAELERLFRALAKFTRAEGGGQTAVEMSPDTVDTDKLLWLKEHGVTRASLGVQSFVEQETRALGRPQKPERVHKALNEMRETGFSVRNIDLIYGVEGQDWDSWQTSLAAALRYEPEELFLYPLYVRPLTGLGRKAKRPADGREELYRRGRDWLLERGYRQVSMRLFRSPAHPGACDELYCCQEDGMIGLGAGARSYTRALHYSSEWAVGRSGVREIIDHFTALPDQAHAEALHGVWLDDEEQRRRYVIKSLLRVDGLDLAAYRTRFGADAVADFPQMEELIESQAAMLTETHLQPTPLGLEWSDVIGPWLYSARVHADIKAFELR